MSEAAPPFAISQELAERWDISSSLLVADTPSSTIYRVVLGNGGTAIVKALKPKGIGELPGMEFLKWCGGEGAIRLLHRSGTVCLIEDAGEIVLREYRLQHGEDAANTVIVDVLRKLHGSTEKPPEGLTPLPTHFAALFRRALTETSPALQEPLRFCASLAENLLATQVHTRPLHGDLHHDNIISGTARGWLAIDPQGLIGDPAYDVANIFGNPLNSLPDIIDPRRIRALTTIFSDMLECREDKVLRYALAHAGLSVCWSLDDETPLEESENARERLAFIRIARSLL